MKRPNVDPFLLRVLIVSVVLVFMVCGFTAYWNLYYLAGHHNTALFSGTMFFCLCLFVFLTLWASDRVDEAWMKSFLAIPAPHEKVTFPVISNFLGEQAIGALLGTALVLSMPTILMWSNAWVAGIYCFLLTAIAILIMVFSLIRFVMFFSKYNWYVYGVASALSLMTMLAFFSIGVKSVS